MWEQTSLIFWQLKAAVRRRVQGNPLHAPLGRLDDRLIDRTLTGLAMERRDLFSPDTLLSPHRRRISAMMSKLGIAVDPVIAHYWSDLKMADHRCAHCWDVARCKQWLDFGQRSDEPKHFCPNAGFFAYIKNRPSPGN